MFYRQPPFSYLTRHHVGLPSVCARRFESHQNPQCEGHQEMEIKADTLEAGSRSGCASLRSPLNR